MRTFFRLVLYQRFTRLRYQIGQILLQVDQ